MTEGGSSRDGQRRQRLRSPPYYWFVVNNISELPPGLTLDSAAPDLNNVVDGTPTQAGTFSFPMQVQDSQDNWTSATLTITINP